MNCEECDKEVSQAVMDYSVKHFETHVFCMDCQGKARKNIPRAEDAKVFKHGDIEIPSDFLLVLNGKQYIKHAGLLWLAHKMGLVGVRSELVSGGVGTDNNYVFKATVRMLGVDADKKGIECSVNEYEAYGDASPKNVNAQVALHVLRMAETRAVSRALRLATGVGMTAVEELGENK